MKYLQSSKYKTEKFYVNLYWKLRVRFQNNLEGKGNWFWKIDRKLYLRLNHQLYKIIRRLED
jgi:hypothetical protein